MNNKNVLVLITIVLLGCFRKVNLTSKYKHSSFENALVIEKDEDINLNDLLKDIDLGEQEAIKIVTKGKAYLTSNLVIKNLKIKAQEFINNFDIESDTLYLKSSKFSNKGKIYGKDLILKCSNISNGKSIDAFMEFENIKIVTDTLSNGLFGRIVANRGHISSSKDENIKIINSNDIIIKELHINSLFDIVNNKKLESEKMYLSIRNFKNLGEVKLGKAFILEENLLELEKTSTGNGLGNFIKKDLEISVGRDFTKLEEENLLESEKTSIGMDFINVEIVNHRILERGFFRSNKSEIKCLNFTNEKEGKISVKGLKLEAENVNIEGVLSFEYVLDIEAKDANISKIKSLPISSSLPNNISRHSQKDKWHKIMGCKRMGCINMEAPLQGILYIDADNVQINKGFSVQCDISIKARNLNLNTLIETKGGISIEVRCNLSHFKYLKGENIEITMEEDIFKKKKNWILPFRFNLNYGGRKIVLLLGALHDSTASYMSHLKKEIYKEDNNRIIIDDISVDTFGEGIEEQADTVFDRLKELGLTSKDKVVIIGHSQGGLRGYALYKKYNDKLNINGLFTLASPWNGARVLNGASNILNTLAKYTDLVRRKSTKQQFKDFTALLDWLATLEVSPGVLDMKPNDTAEKFGIPKSVIKVAFGMLNQGIKIRGYFSISCWVAKGLYYVADKSGLKDAAINYLKSKGYEKTAEIIVEMTTGVICAVAGSKIGNAISNTKLAQGITKKGKETLDKGKEILAKGGTKLKDKVNEVLAKETQLADAVTGKGINRTFKDKATIDKGMKFAKDESGKDYEVGKNYNKALDEFNKKSSKAKVPVKETNDTIGQFASNTPKTYKMGRNEITFSTKEQYKDMMSKIPPKLRDLAKDVKDVTNGYITSSKKGNGVRIIKPVKEDYQIIIRIMNKGGRRDKPYFKIYDSNNIYYDSLGNKLNKGILDKLQKGLFQELSHIDVTKNSKKQIISILNNIKKGGNK